MSLCCDNIICNCNDLCCMRKAALDTRTVFSRITPCTCRDSPELRNGRASTKSETTRFILDSGVLTARRTRMEKRDGCQKNRPRYSRRNRRRRLAGSRARFFFSVRQCFLLYDDHSRGRRYGERSENRGNIVQFVMLTQLIFNYSGNG